MQPLKMVGKSATMADQRNNLKIGTCRRSLAQPERSIGIPSALRTYVTHLL